MPTIEDRMKALAKKHSGLRKGKGAEIWKELTSIVCSFQSGQLAHAFSSFYALLCSHLEEMRTYEIAKDSCLYRMRKGTNDLEEYTSEYEMSHIPFELNHLVSNERFSISGFPSLYMGSSVYACWEELHRPPFDFASVALFKTRQEIQVIDLSEQEHYHFTNEVFSDCLTLACSLPVTYPDAPFKPEYIIPQLLMQSLVQYMHDRKENNLWGIRYTSTHVKDGNLWIQFPRNKRNRKLFYNFVFPAFDRKPIGLSDSISNLFCFWNATTYNKIRLMRTDFLTANNAKRKTAFELVEEFLINMPLSGMLPYDGTNPRGALTLGNRNI